MVHASSRPVSYWAATAGAEPDGIGPFLGGRMTEVAVIGGGVTGVAAAHRVATALGGAVVLVEADRIGAGATGRSAGVARFAFGPRPLARALHAGRVDAARQRLEESRRALDVVRELIAGEAIACEAQPGGWLTVAHRRRHVRALLDAHALYRRLGHTDIELLDRPALEARGFLRGSGAHAALRIGTGFALDPLRFVRGLAAAARRRGAALYDCSPVLRWTADGAWHVLATPGGTLRTRRVIVATNAYTPAGLHPALDGRVLPAFTSVLVTRPLTAAEWAATGMTTTQAFSDTRALPLTWRRLPDGRLLLARDAGVLDAPWAREARRRRLEHVLGGMFPALRGITTDWFWEGKVCPTRDGRPRVHAIEGDPSVVYALGCGSADLAMATVAGRLAADLALGAAVPHEASLAAAPLPRSRLHPLRLLVRAGVQTVAALTDRVI